MRDADQMPLLVVAGDHPLLDLAEARRVVLLLGLRLERATLAGDQNAIEPAVRHLHAAAQAENARLVEGLSGRVVLLPVSVTGLRIGRHDDPRLGAVDTGLP